MHTTTRTSDGADRLQAAGYLLGSLTLLSIRGSGEEDIRTGDDWESMTPVPEPDRARHA